MTTKQRFYFKPVAAGGGGSNPDPAVYCPANGYIPDPRIDPYVSPVDIGTPSSEEIILLCSNSGIKYVACRASITGGTWYAQVYDKYGNLITTSTNLSSNATWSYTFPSGYDYLIIKLKINGAYSFSSYQNGNYSSAPGYGDYPILEAKFNTPNITSLYYAFGYVTSIRKVSFDCTLNYLTNMSYMFFAGGMINYTLPPSLPALTTIQSMFQNNNIIVKVDMSNCSVPLLSNISTVCSTSAAIYEFIFPASMPEATTFVNAFYNSGLVKVTMPTSAPKATSYLNLVYGCTNLTGDVIIPESNVCTNISSLARACPKLERALINGDFSAATVNDQIVYNASNLKELQLPSVLGGTTINYGIYQGTTELEKLTLPNSMPQATTSIAVVGSVMGKKIKEFRGNCSAPLSSARDFYYPYSYVEVVECPNFNAYRFFVGVSASNLAPVTSINIDWTNSGWNSSYLPCIQIFANLDATELNRIYGLLPTVSGALYRMVVSGCPGYGGSNPAIATAKGWTVN